MGGKLNFKKILFIFSVFLLGLLLGVFVTVAVIREALPLRDHVIIIGIYLLTALPVLIILFAYYLSTISYLKEAVGTKAGEIVGRVLTFFLVSLLVFSILFLGLLFSAIA